MRYRKCPGCGYVGSEDELQRNKRYGAPWNSMILPSGYRCPKCRTAGDGWRFRFAKRPEPAAGTSH
jgi:hypothetical protein